MRMRFDSDIPPALHRTRAWGWCLWMMVANGCFSPQGVELSDAGDDPSNATGASTSSGSSGDADPSGSTSDDPDASTSAASEGPGLDAGDTTDGSKGDATTAAQTSTGTTGDGDPTTSGPTDGTSTESGETTETIPGCAAGQPIRCENGELIVCDASGEGEEASSCALGCHTEEIRCNAPAPSNGLAAALDDARGADPVDLGTTATIDTDTGAVTADGTAVAVPSVVLGAAPTVRVLLVGSLVAQDVAVSGTSALAIVSDGAIRLVGHLSLSAAGSRSGPGRLNGATCQGGDQVVAGTGGNTAAGGVGGGGFGSAGGRGGTARAMGSIATGGTGGGTTGNATLIPLRGGCDSGVSGASLVGAGGGAIQLVSRTRISVQGVLSANGSSGSGGGSGGGILLEAPVVEVSGAVVANGGSGGSGGIIPRAGENGRLDATPAVGAIGTDVNLGDGGNGAAGVAGATNGQDIAFASGLGTDLNFAGHGGGGVGRIRINTFEDRGFDRLGLLSPNPTTGALGLR